MPEDHDERDDFDNDYDDFGDDGDPGHDWAQPGYPPPYGAGTGRGRNTLRRGLLLAAVALVASGAAFAVADAAISDVSGSPAASASAGPTPSSSAPPGGTGGGTQVSPPGGGLSSLPPGAMEQLEIGGPVTAVSATSITIGSGSRAVTATVTSATKITGKVTGIGAIKVGDLVSASLAGPSDGKLTATSIQDPASLPSGLSQ
jgi:hypothetical protein